MTNKTLIISFIVSTRNRDHSLIDCFNSIAAACIECADIQAELVVVDNGSTDNTQEVTKYWAKRNHFPVTLVYEPQAGLSRARNSGILAAKGHILAFTDDDCRLRLDYVKNLYHYFKDETELVMRGGQVELGDPKDLPLTIKVDNQAAIFAHPMHPAGFLLGANMVLPKAMIDKIGMFDERFGAGTAFPGEDCDYIIRANLKRMRIEYCPDLVVYHFHGRRDATSAKKLFSGYMRANGALYIKHLFSRPLLIKHFFWDFGFWMKEIRGHKNALHEAGVGHRDVVLYSMEGMVLFLFHMIMDILFIRRKNITTVKRINIMESTL